MKTDTALKVLAALGNEARLAAFRELVQAGPEGLAVGELRDRLDLPAATLTAQLNLLRNAALVHDEREGRVIRVRANYLQMTDLIAYLTENCCSGKAVCEPTSGCTPRRKGASK